MGSHLSTYHLMLMELGIPQILPLETLGYQMCLACADSH